MTTGTIVVGAGIVGLATALQILQRAPGTSVVVVEKEPAVGQHQSGHNSGVLHAGVYYAPGSLKAELCVRGQLQMEAFAAEHGVALHRNGKVIVALNARELPRLQELARRAKANGVRSVQWLERSQLRADYPAVAGIAGLLSPTTASIDFPGACRAMADQVQQRGGELHLATSVRAIHERATEVVVATDRGDFSASTAVVCAGLQADRLAPDSRDARIVPFRGRWYQLKPAAADMVAGHVYPVPDPRFPFLGVHASRRIDGTVWLGPNAVLALARERYGGGVNAADVRDLVRFRGTWQLARRNVTTGVRELYYDRWRSAYLRLARQYLPDLRDDDVEDGRRDGIRAQLVRRNGDIVDDFDIATGSRTLHVRSAPSPAATASLAIGEVLAEKIAARSSP